MEGDAIETRKTHVQKKHYDLETVYLEKNYENSTHNLIG
jgi:hypothetical protein